MAAAQTTPSSDTIETLPHGERWFTDGFAVMQQPGGAIFRQCDLSQAQQALQTLRARGLPATWTHLFVRATALGLQRYPDGHQLVCGYRRLRPGRVDIGLSVAGRTSYAPVLIIEGAEQRPLPELVGFMSAAVPSVREKEVIDLEGMNRLGWLVPFGRLRRFILRRLSRSLWFRRRLIGTFQVTCVPSIDFGVPLMFYSGAALAFGRVTDRVIAVAGQPVVRPTVYLGLAFDHKSMDGRIAANLLEAIIRVFESDELLKESIGEAGHTVGELPIARPLAEAG